MKLITIIAILAAVELFDVRSFAGTPSETVLVATIQSRTNLVRVTQKPIQMASWISLLCTLPTPKQIEAEKSNPHQRFVHVYVNTAGTNAMAVQKMVFPVGTLILKEKFADSTGTKTELFTGMVKQEAGYNPGCGDWEFFTADANGKKITSRGKLTSCMDCHEGYKASDFVSHKYLMNSK